MEQPCPEDLGKVPSVMGKAVTTDPCFTFLTTSGSTKRGSGISIAEFTFWRNLYVMKWPYSAWRRRTLFPRVEV